MAKITGSKEKLIKKIREKTAPIAVVGLGRVGLPTAAMFAHAGYHVTGADINKERVNVISSMKCPFTESGLNELIERVVKKRKLKATTDTVQAVREADVAIVCVQTPVTEDKKPDLTYLQTASEAVAEGLSKGKLVVVESSVPPGTMKNLVARTLEEESGLRCGEDFWLVYCPETMAPGRALQEFVENPRVVGGYNLESAQIATELFRMIAKGKTAITDCMSAEVAKLAGNTFRDVNIAFVNQLSLICERIGVDVMEVIRLVSMHPRTKNIHRPGCGVGGPCLTKDPYLLLSSVKEKRFESEVIQSSREMNDQVPYHVVEVVIRALKKAGKDVKNSKIGVLGSAYKGEVDDATASPAEKIIYKLMDLGAEIVVYDPYSEETFGAEKAMNVMDAIERADLVVIATDHKMFRELELETIKMLMSEKPVIVDCVRVVDFKRAKKDGFLYCGTGYNIRMEETSF
jgi:UDP-N-acetyl-D-mannosaminuronic acid dehydrogenase